jgi:hypothetical protein
LLTLAVRMSVTAGQWFQMVTTGIFLAVSHAPEWNEFIVMGDYSAGTQSGLRPILLSL